MAEIKYLHQGNEQRHQITALPHRGQLVYRHPTAKAILNLFTATLEVYRLSGSQENDSSVLFKGVFYTLQATTWCCPGVTWRLLVHGEINREGSCRTPPGKSLKVPKKLKVLKGN